MKNSIESINKKLFEVINSMPGVFYWKDKAGVYLGCNDFPMPGLEKSEKIIGKTDYDLYPKEEADIIRSNDIDVMESGKSIYVEEQVTLPNGHKMDFMVNKLPLKDENDCIIGLIGTSINITQLKQQQEELKAAKKQAEVASQAKSNFLANIRHDFRTCLTGIVTISEVLASHSKSDTEIKELTDILTQSSHQFMCMLEEILTTVNIESGSVPIVKKPFSIKDITRQVLSLHAAAAVGKQINLSQEQSNVLPEHVVGDGERIKRILVELISNAIKFTSDGGSITVQTNCHPSNNDQLLLTLSVIDNGIGIPKELHHKLFIQFERGTPAYDAKYPGLGLGLSNVKRLIDDLKAQIEVKSEPDKGSTFTCYIPVDYSLIENIKKADITSQKPI